MLSESDREILSEYDLQEVAQEPFSESDREETIRESHESLTSYLDSAAFTFSRNLSEADTVRLFFILKSEIATKSLISNMSYRSVYGDEKLIRSEATIHDADRSNSFTKGLAIGLIFTLFASCIAISAVNTFAPFRLTIVQEQR